MRYHWIACVAVLFLAAGCSHKKVAPDQGAIPETNVVEENLLGSSDDGKALGLKTVHFGYDSYLLDAEAKDVLKTNGDILRAHPSLKIQIEGHCDQRGGVQYNIALGEKRANAARNYLLDSGIDGQRIAIISYGKERLLDRAETEAAYAKNRRGNFVVTNK